MSKTIEYILRVMVFCVVTSYLAHCSQIDCKSFDEFQRSLMVIPVEYDEDEAFLDDSDDEEFSIVKYCKGDKECH